MEINMKEFFYDILHLYDYDRYEYFEITPNALRMIFLFAWVGIIIALFGSFYSNNYLGRFVKKLIEAGADSSENAKTLRELGIDGTGPIRRSLRDGSVLRRTVEKVEPEQTGEGSEPKAELSDPDRYADRYYIPKEKQAMAQKRFRVKGNGIGTVFLCVGISTVALLLLLIYGPWLFGILDSFMASF